MTKWFTYLLRLVLFAVALPISCADSLPAEWNHLAEDVKTWVGLLNSAKPGTIDAREYAAWSNVKTSWHRVEKDFDGYYHK